MRLFLAFSAALIDDCAVKFYNRVMEKPINQELYSETSEPPRSIIRSDLLLYVLVLLLVVLLIFVVSALIVVFELPELLSQLTLFAFLWAFGWRLYRVRLISYRYTLTERMLSVERIVGRRVKPELAVHLADITGIRPCSALSGEEGGKRERLYLGKKADATAVTYRVSGVPYTMLLSMSEEMRTKLIAQWKLTRR